MGGSFIPISFMGMVDVTCSRIAGLLGDFGAACI
jgi:hypothetical protein